MVGRYLLPAEPLLQAIFCCPFSPALIGKLKLLDSDWIAIKCLVLLIVPCAHGPEKHVFGTLVKGVPGSSYHATSATSSSLFSSQFLDIWVGSRCSDKGLSDWKLHLLPHQQKLDKYPWFSAVTIQKHAEVFEFAGGVQPLLDACTFSFQSVCWSYADFDFTTW